jgi:hypothetical protein
MNTHDDRDARFDAAARQLHQAAVRRVPGRTLLQLQQRPAASRAARDDARHRFGWPLAASFAAALALVVGLQLPRHDAAPQAAPTTVANADADTDDLDTVLDENPDFYLWLASSDAHALAME